MFTCRQYNDIHTAKYHLQKSQQSDTGFGKYAHPKFSICRFVNMRRVCARKHLL